MASVFSEPARHSSAPMRPLAAAVLSAVAGFLVWSVLSVVAGRMVDDQFVVREAWDTGAYWLLGLPIIAMVSAAAALIAPRRVWRWPLAAALGQTLGMVLVHPPGIEPALAPVAAVFVGVPLVLLMTVPALVAGMAARGGWSDDLLR